MLSRIIASLNPKLNPDLEESPFERARLATAVLFVDLARCDGFFDETERDVITKLLRERFTLTFSQADSLVRYAEKEIDSVWEDCWDNRKYCNRILGAYSKTERARLVEMLWEIAYTDGALAPFETSLIWQTANRIGVSAPATENARRTVLARFTQEAA